MNLLISIPIAIIAIIIFGFDINSFPLLSPDESRYAEAAREMLENGNYIVPHCDYLPRFDKPILFYWLTILSYKIFGINELATRLPSVLAGTGLVLLSFGLGSIHGFGITAALITLSSLFIFIFSKIAITDLCLCFFISATLVFFYLAYYDINNKRRSFSFKDKISSPLIIFSSLSMALGMLCKGPIAVILPSIIIISFLVYKRDFKNFILDSWLELLISLVVFTVVTIPWYVAIDIATHGAFTQKFFLHHNISRFFTVYGNHHAPIWFYIPITFFAFFPWSFFIVQSFSKINLVKPFSLNSEEYKIRDTMFFCLIWFLTIFTFFTLCKTKLATYILPALIPLAIINASWWYEKFKIKVSSKFKNLDALIGFIALFIFLIIGIVLLSTIFKQDLTKISPNAFLIPLAIVGFILFSSILVCMTAIFESPKLSFILLAISCIISYLILTKFVLITYAEFRDDGSKVFTQSLKDKTQLGIFEIHSTRFNFYSTCKIKKYNTLKQIRQDLETNTKPIIIITKKKNKNKLLEIKECQALHDTKLKQAVHAAFNCE